MLDDFLDRAAEQPDAVAIVTYLADGSPAVRHTYGELELLSRRCAGALLDLGVDSGDVVSLQLANGWEFPALVYGILRIGAVVNPLVPIFRNRELDFILRRTESKVLVVPDRIGTHDHAEMGLELLHQIDSLEHLVVIGDHISGIDFGEYFVGRPWEEDVTLESVFEQRRPGPDDLVEIQYTSGTTGEPKGVLHSHNTVYSGGRTVDDVYGLCKDDVCFMASTLAHQTGFCYGMCKPLSMGMKIVYQERWNADQMLDAVEAEGIAWTVSATASLWT